MNPSDATPSAAPTVPPAHRRILTRRRFLLGLAGVGCYTWQVEPRWAKVVERPLAIRGLPASLHGKSLVHLSDIHVGPVSESYLVSWFREISRWKPVLIAITGDFMSANHTERISDVARLLAHLEPASLGTFAVLGNHDYGTGWKNQSVADALVRELLPLGVQLLRNRVIDVAGLQIYGLDDLWSGNFDLEAVTDTLDFRRPMLGLCHNPDGVDLLGWRDVRGWILSGHTHGGQCKSPFLPPPLLPVRNRRYTSGEFELTGDRRLYISRGIGHILKVRFNVRPEVTRFELHADE